MRLTAFRPLVIAVALCSMSAFSAAIAGPFDKIDSISETSLASFQKVYIAPVKVELDETNLRRNIRDLRGDRPVSETDRARKAQDSYEDITRAFGRKFEIVDAPGEGVLTVETTIKKLVSTRPTLADFREAPSLSFNSLYAGGGTFDIRLSQNDTPLVEISDTYVANFNDGRVRVNTWDDYNRASSRIARKLVRYVRKS